MLIETQSGDEKHKNPVRLEYDLEVFVTSWRIFLFHLGGAIDEGSRNLSRWALDRPVIKRLRLNAIRQGDKPQRRTSHFCRLEHLN